MAVTKMSPHDPLVLAEPFASVAHTYKSIICFPFLFSLAIHFCQSSYMSWSSLSPELRLGALRELRSSPCRPFESPRHRKKERRATGLPSQSRYACVSREWNLYFEADNLEHLVLSNRDVRTFSKFVTRANREHMVRWIWLRIELPTHGCDKCSKPE
jgi:hypothetical protein